MKPTEPEINELLTNTKNLINHVHWFELTPHKPSGKSHKGVSIAYIDIHEKKDDFLRELKGTICNWVYSKNEYNKIFQEQIKARGDVQNTAAYIEILAKEKFRPGHPQGQLGELLLFNFIQFFFKAPPLLRKMPITTNPNLERNGADAIHYKIQDGVDTFILGESKCYKSEYKFNQALQESISSIKTSLDQLSNELVLYIYDDFIEPKLTQIAKNFKDGKLINPKIELVCLIAYQENTELLADPPSETIENIKECITKRYNDSPDNLLSGIPKPIIDRIHYIAFPFKNLDEILSKFS